MSKVSSLERKRNSTEITPSNIIVAETNTRQTGRSSWARTALMESAPADQVTHSTSDHAIAESTGRVYLPSFGRPGSPRRTREGKSVYGLAIRLPSTKEELRYDPMTRKGRGRIEATHETYKENTIRYKYFTDDGPILEDSAEEESLPNVDDYRAEETEVTSEATPEFEADSNLDDKKNLRPGWDNGLKTDALSGEFTVSNESAAGTPSAHQAQPSRRPLGELPVTSSQEPMGESEEDEARNNLHPIARQAENLRRAAAGEPPIRRSSLSREVMTIPDVYTENYPASHAPPFSRARAPPPDQSFSDHIYPLSSRPLNESCEVTIPVPGTDRSPMLVLQPPDEESSPRTKSDIQ
ncbi:MAG: hypothetical protein Q9185_005924 [Variospora sp. 1 TL-2023]